MPAPSKIQWEGPSGLTVKLDEDGIAVTWRAAGGIEEPEIEQLLDLIAAAREAKAGPLGPQRPTRAEIMAFSYVRQGERLAEVFRRALVDDTKF